MTRRSAAGILPVSSTQPSPAASQSGLSVLKCCAASNSVGAISADCAPLSAIAAIAISATTVLPEPTSPCSRRDMRSGEARSARISVNRLLLPFRQLKGQRLRYASR